MASRGLGTKLKRGGRLILEGLYTGSKAYDV